MKKLTFLSVTLLILLIFNGCRKEEFYSQEQSDTLPENENYNEGQVILGKQLENPYSVENIKIAYEKLISENILKSGLKIEPTHFYVRFRPKNDMELDLLNRDTTLYIYDYPLDVEIKKGGTYYHDPEIPKNEITWQYTVVPVDYDFPKVQYQKLADLYLPEDGKELTRLKSAQIDHFDWKKLETEALRITGNLSENEQNGANLKSTTWRPAGSIKVYDDVINSYSSTIKIFSHYDYFYCDTGEPVFAEDPTEDIPEGGDGGSGVVPDGENICARPVYHYVTNSINSHYIPLEGAEVRARRWFTTHTGIVDANGNFTCDGTFDKDANYSIKWERNDFDIRDGSYGQAYFNGPDMTGNWNLIIQDINSPKSYLFAHIFRAAHTYYYKNYLWGIKTPTDRGFLNQRLHIGGRVESNYNSHYFDFNTLRQAATVLIHRNNKNSRGIFSTTIHELAHVSHWDQVGTFDINWLINKRITESWAMGVEAVITSNVYGSILEDETYQDRTIEFMTSGDYEGYTCIVWDLIDNVNQHGTLSAYPNDQVYGYTLWQIEDALPSIFGSWWTWRDNLIADYNNASEEYVSTLFDQLK